MQKQPKCSLGLVFIDSCDTDTCLGDQAPKIHIRNPKFNFSAHTQVAEEDSDSDESMSLDSGADISFA